MNSRTGTQHVDTMRGSAHVTDSNQLNDTLKLAVDTFNTINHPRPS